MKRTTAEARFWAKVQKTDTCWLWTAGRTRFGHGKFTTSTQGRERTHAAHRYSYALAHGAIPPGLCIRHICHVPACVNPAHLVTGTVAENVADRVRCGRNGTRRRWHKRPVAPVRATVTADERFWSKVDKTKTEACWTWHGPRDEDGYGVFRLSVPRRCNVRAHRYSYEREYGPLAADKQLNHRCNNRACVRPNHLYAGTPQENSADMVRAGHAATGQRNGKYTQPQATPRGDQHWARCRPELVRRGERVAGARLTAEDVRAMRALHDDGAASKAELARRYGVTRQNVRCVVERKTWKHVP